MRLFSVSVLLHLHVLLVTAAVHSRPNVGQDAPSDGFTVTLTHHRHQSWHGSAFHMNSTTNLLEQDLFRAKLLRQPLNTNHPDYTREAFIDVAMNESGGLHSENLQNRYFIYTAAVKVGSNGTTYNLLVDTGSSNTWVGAHTPYHKTNTSYETNDKVAVNYGSGHFEGVEYVDTITLTPELVISNQSIGAATMAQGFTGLDGVLGLGPVELTRGSLRPSNESLVPTILENLQSQGMISSQVFGISFTPTGNGAFAAETGELTWGRINENQTTFPIRYVPITNATHAGRYWGFDQSITYGNSSTTTGDGPLTILNATSGIVDTGTSLLLLPSSAFGLYMNVTGAKWDLDTGLLRITPEQYEDLQSLYFHIQGATFEWTPNAQIWPRRLNKLIRGSPDYFYLVVGGLGSVSEGGLNFINGFVWLQRFYSVFDVENRRLGFAETASTYSMTN